MMMMMMQQKRKPSGEGEGEPLRKCPFTSSFSSEQFTSTISTSNVSATSSLTSPSSSTSTKDTNNDAWSRTEVNLGTVSSGETAEVSRSGVGNESGNKTLREFDVLDEEEYDQESDNQMGDSDSDVPDEEIESMLDAVLPSEYQNSRRHKKGQNEDGNSSGGDANCPYEEKEKVVLEELAHNHFDMLPEGWVQVTHGSGMPIYLHKQSRVVTLAPPYFLGPGSARKHDIPLCAIPCLQYRRALENEEEKLKEEAAASTNENGANIQTVNGFPLPSASIETIQENKAKQTLTPENLREYCEKLFRFKVIKVLRFKLWSERRRFTKQKKDQRLQRPTLPEETKLIKFPLPVTNPDNSNGPNNARGPKEWIMNPNGKSYVCILHEYVQHALKKQPSYEFRELENAATPYSATVAINGMQYGIGYGTSKKQAKSEAAKATLEILIPGMKEKIQEDKRIGARGTSKEQNSDLSEDPDAKFVLRWPRDKQQTLIVFSKIEFFDEIKIEDPRVAELCAKTTEPSPYAILLTCLQRNFGLGEMHIHYEVSTVRHQKNEFTMTVGKHTVKVICRNKRDGKQRASQAILQALHPHITSWGSLLRLYGNRSVKSIKEKKQEEQEITLLQSKASINSPNFAILKKLKEEMEKVKIQQDSVQPVGKFVPPDDIALPSSSGADLNNVEI